MRMPRLQIEATYGKIGINAQNAKLSIHQQKADMKIIQPKAKMIVHSVPAKLEIDQTQAFAEENNKPILQVNLDYARRGREAVMKGIARRAEEGDILMKIENGGHPIAELAREDSSDPPLEFNIGWMPRSALSVKYHFIPGQFSIQWVVHHPEVKVTPHYPTASYTPGSLEVYMRQWPSLKIKVVGGKYDANI